MMSDVPQREEMYNPLLQALRDLGGSGTNDEIADRVIKILNVPDEVASVLHSTDNSNETELEYRLAWARTYLKNFGMLERSGRGVWAIKADKQTIERVDPTKVNRFTQAMLRARHTDSQGKDKIPSHLMQLGGKLCTAFLPQSSIPQRSSGWSCDFSGRADLSTPKLPGDQVTAASTAKGLQEWLAS